VRCEKALSTCCWGISTLLRLVILLIIRGVCCSDCHLSIVYTLEPGKSQNKFSRHVLLSR